jgi:uncharacterized protein YndB with AHSA1/START domain
MRTRTTRFEREVDLPRVIVWDALIDPALVAGWLADAVVDERVGGRFELSWRQPSGRPPTLGRIVVLEPPERLEIATDTLGMLGFTLEELPGGSRGTSTLLTVTIGLEVEKAFTARMRADWLQSLDQLEDLLRGHPVDWAHWERDHGESWTRHLGETGSG